MTSSSHTDGRGLTSLGEPAAPGLAARLGQVARTLDAEPDLADTLQAIVDAAVVNVAGADVAGITVVNARGELSAPAVTDDLVVRVDQVQYDVQQGPCLSSLREAITVRADDLRTETRWPRFARRAADMGVLSMLAFQLYVQEAELGSLNLYSRKAGGFDHTDEEVGLLFAVHAAVAMAGAGREQHLRTAMNSRDLIGQAKGILMERGNTTAEQAFTVLMKTSQRCNRKLADVAADLIRTRQLPQPSMPRQRGTVPAPPT